MNAGQKQALSEMRSIEAARPGAVEIVDSWTGTGGSLVIDTSVDCRGLEHRLDGMRIRQRERFRIFVPSTYPFRPPSTLVTHRRWKGSAHVQWGGSLCLYQSVESEWNPSDGMFGYLERLLEWLAAAAKGVLDPDDAPLHPPVAYPVASMPLFIPRVDTPEVSGGPWVGFGLLEQHAEHRYDIVGWTDSTGLNLEQAPIAGVFLLDSPLPFEFPTKLGPLLSELATAGVKQEQLVAVLRVTALVNGEDSIHVIVGTPMRRPAGSDTRQHLTVWRIGKDDLESFRLSLPDDDDSVDLAAARSELRDAVERWAEVAQVEWCPVREARPEVTRPRDEGSVMRWWAGRSAEIWGCGALGSRVAEELCRSGIRRLVLRDRSTVTPGVLVRQNFIDEDIGLNKATALASRLLAIRPDLEVAAEETDLTSRPPIGGDWGGGADVVLDLTASPAVSKRLELLRLADPNSTAIVGMLVGHEASSGLVVTATANATGGTADANRKAKIEASRRPGLRLFADEFWPDPARTDVFQPEPGCSDPTFAGSDTEVSALASQMLLEATTQLKAAGADMTATFVSIGSRGASTTVERMAIAPDVTLSDSVSGYEIRVAASALAEIRAWVRNSERQRPGYETGGILFGERDDSIGVLWISDVLGPPPDSLVAPEGFICGVAGVDDASVFLRNRSRDASRPIGMWHTHPGASPAPSDTDERGMRQLVEGVLRSLPKQLLLIVGGAPESRSMAAYLYERGDDSRRVITSSPVALPDPSPSTDRIGLALSGGGFRAVAFHLGVLRALHDREVLEGVDVISAVSGGSLIAAMWAYSEDGFEEFDARVVELLKRGLTKDIAKAALLTRRAPQALYSTLRSGTARLRNAVATWTRRLTRDGRQHPRHRSVEPLPRLIHRTNAFEDVLRRRLFGDLTIDRPLRGTKVVINACDLRSGSAFRFGSVDSGSARYGRLSDNTEDVATAVAASAAYPFLLPAIDVERSFTTFDGRPMTARVLLTDGGVYDNLGTTPLEPGRSPGYSTNVHPVDFIVSADAGHGLMDIDAWPQWWPSRVKRSFESIYRKVQDGGKARLHKYATDQEIKGFAMPFLGQIDEALPYRSPDLVPREAVRGYPTDFEPMSEGDLMLLATRGEQLTRLLVEHHCPDIA